MRYELYFTPSSPVVPDRASFERHFAGRANYTVSKGVASYRNEDTGVSYAFDCQLSKYPAEASRHGAWGRFALELIRPSFFAEEAIPELDAFSERFGASFVQAPDWRPTSYNKGLFLRSWETANRTACGPYPASAPPDKRPLTLPRARVLEIWQWNYRRKALQESEGESLFVPRIWFIRMGEGVGTSVVWLDAMAVRTPQVDYVIFSREMLAPRSRIGPQPDVAVAPWSVIAPRITGQAFYDAQIANWRVTDPRVLNGLARTVSSLRGTTDLPEVIPPEHVLDREGFGE